MSTNINQLLPLARKWATVYAWELLAERFAAWQKASQELHRVQNAALEESIVQEKRRKQHRPMGASAGRLKMYKTDFIPARGRDVQDAVRLLEADRNKIGKLHLLLKELRPDLNIGPDVWLPDPLTPIDRASRVRDVLSKLEAPADGRTKSRADKPKWEGGILTFGSITVKTIGRHPATNQRELLDAFEAAGWPMVITNPLRDVNNKTSPRTLNETLRDLNASIKTGPLRFEADGNGGCRWIQNSP